MTTTKRTNGEGSPRQLANGSWQIRFYLPDGKRTACTGKTLTEAKAKVKLALAKAEQGQPLTDSRMLVKDWFAEWSTSTLAYSSRALATKTMYETLGRLHIASGEFGALSLRSVTPRHVESLLQHMAESGLSESTVRSAYAVLRTMFDGAVRDQMLGTNPVASVKRPKVTPKDAAYLEAGDVQRLLDAAKGQRYAGVLELLAATGMRRGEVLGLKWENVDLDRGVLNVRTTLGRVDHELRLSGTKTERSRRAIPLGPRQIDLLRSMRLRQLEERLVAGSQWTDSGLVFTTSLGTGVDGRNINHMVKRVVAKAGLEGKVSPHTLRHSAATGMLHGGIPIHAVSQALGHSSITITADTYGHVSLDDRRRALDAWSDQLKLG
jgi:integrase